MCRFSSLTQSLAVIPCFPHVTITRTAAIIQLAAPSTTPEAAPRTKQTHYCAFKNLVYQATRLVPRLKIKSFAFFSLFLGTDPFILSLRSIFSLKKDAFFNFFSLQLRRLFFSFTFIVVCRVLPYNLR